MIIRKAVPEDNQRAREISAICFEFSLRPQPADAVPEEEKFYRLVALTDDETEMMGTITVNDYQIQFDGHSCRMGGIGSVATLPQYRRQGCIRACFNAVLEDMYAAGYDFSYLYPFSTAYYRKFGYESCVQRVSVRVQLDTLSPPAADGTLCLAESKNPLTDAIRTVDRFWESRFNLMVQHTQDDYSWTAKLNPAAQEEYTYVYFSDDGTPKAYSTFRSEDRSLRCSRFYFTDKEGFNGLMQLFKSMSSDHRAVQFMLPAVSSMQYLLPELALESVECTCQTIGMVRIINAKSALEKAKYRGSGSITLKINDLQISQNNRTYAITFAGGRAVSVKETDNEPDALLNIPAFSALLMGAADFEDAGAFLSGIEIKNENACFRQVFYSKKMMIADFF